ncbi:hypothetical protein ACJZ2D_004189 [Fusarium nematophilum]
MEQRQGQQAPGLQHQHTLIGLADTPWTTSKVPLGPPENGSLLDQLVVDDSDSDAGQTQEGKRAGCALSAVRNRLIRSISQDTDDKHPSLASLGSSEEEIARRAELRRLMRKRIQDELQNEQGEDDLGDKPAHSIRCLASVVNLSMPSSGPRDAIEFAVHKSPSLDARTTRDDKSPPELAQIQSLDDTITSQKALPTSLSGPTHGGKATKRDRNETGDSYSEAHPSPSQSLRPGQVLQSHSQKSFQLSNGAARLDRVLGPDCSFNSRHASSCGDGHSALGVWLIAQGLRSRDNSMSYFGDDEAGSSDKNDQGQAYSKVTKEENKRLASDEDNVSGTRDNLLSDNHPVVAGPPGTTEPNCDSELQRCMSNREHDLSSQLNQQPKLRRSEDARGNPARAAFFNPVADNTSSSYPSKFPSFQPSPAHSQQNLYTLNLKDIESMELSPFKWKSLYSSPEEGNSDAQQPVASVGSGHPAQPLSSENVQKAPHAVRIECDATSQLHSETASFLQRETELRTIETRFAGVLTCKKPARYVNSRFREEFNEPVLGQSSRKSFIDKIHLTVPSRFRTSSRGSGCRQDENLPRVRRSQESEPTASGKRFGHRKEASDRSKRCSNLSIRSHMSPLSSETFQRPELERQESATGLWQRAIRLEAEARCSSSNNLSTPDPDHQHTAASSRSPEGTVARKGYRNGSQCAENTSREASQLTPTTDEISYGNNSKWLIQRWVAQMRPETPHALEGAESMISLKSAPPKSWARFPSHNREQRNKYASTRDNVQSRDFAVTRVSPEGEVCWSTDQDQNDAAQRAGTIPKSLSMRLGEAVRSRIVKLMPSRHVQDVQGQVSAKGRANAQLNHLEYPELEILPTESGYEELQILEKEISNMKGDGRPETRQDEQPGPRSTKSLGDKISALMHEATRDNQHNHDNISTCTEVPVAPVTPSLLRESIAATELFVTPQSRVSAAGNSHQQRASSDADSIRNERQGTPTTPVRGVNAVTRPRSSTWTGKVLRKLAPATTLQVPDEDSTSTPRKGHLNDLTHGKHLVETKAENLRRHSR